MPFALDQPPALSGGQLQFTEGPELTLPYSQDPTWIVDPLDGVRSARAPEPR